jgi:hypothetical protein
VGVIIDRNASRDARTRRAMAAAAAPIELGLVQDGDRGDVVVAGGGGGTWTIDARAVTYAKLQAVATDRLLGRDTAGTGDAEELTVGGGIEFTGTGGIQTGAFTGDVTKAAGGTALTLPNVNANVGAFNNVLVNAKGQVTAAANVAYLTGNQVITLSGDASGSGATAIVVTFPNVNANVGTFNNLTVNAKGQVTAASNAAYLTSVGLGNLTALTTKGDLLGFSTLHARVAVGTDGQILSADSTQATGVKWIANAANPLTTKGDLFTYDTGAQRLAAGANGTFLVADSTQTTGLKWRSLHFTDSAGDPGSVAAGDAWYDTTNGSQKFYSVAGHVLSYLGTLYHLASQSGDAIVSSNTETNYTVGGTIVFGTIKANGFGSNRQWIIDAAGTMGSAAGTATLTIRVKIGTTTALTFTVTPATGTGGKWRLKAYVCTRTTGGAGTAQCDGELVCQGLTTQVDVQGSVAVDTTIDRNVFLTGQWSAISATNTTKIQRFNMVEVQT